MRVIYEKATRVIVWPGDSDSSRLASAMLYSLYGTPFMFEGSAQNFEVWYSHERHSPRWLALVELLNNPYFSRIWIVQEVAVASDVQVLHGGLYIPWEILIEVMAALWHPHRRSSLSYTSNSDMRKFYQSSHGDSTHNAMNLYLLYANHGKVPLSAKHDRLPSWECLQLGKLLALCSKFKSTDHRDKVFALVGLVAETIPPLITIDYEESLAQVYTKATRNILRQEETYFDILSHAGIGYRIKTDDADLVNTLPSWVPDWSVQRLGYTFASREGGGYGYSTSKHTEVGIAFPQHVSEPLIDLLSLKGTNIDIIDKLGCTLDTQRESDEISVSDYSTTVYHWYEEARSIALRNPTDPYPTRNQSRAEAFWWTLVGDATQQVRPAPPEFALYFTLWIRLLAILQALGSRAALQEILERNDPRAAAMKTALADNTTHAGILEYSNNLAETSVGRRLCVTNGGYMGLVPPMTEVGDLVCIIAGAPTPYLLRRYTHDSPKRSSMELYELVGECFIHGRMDRVDILEKDWRIFAIV